MRIIELAVTITDAAVDEKVTTIFCSPVIRDPRCPDCGRDGSYRDTIIRALTDLPVAGYPLVLRVAVPRYRCLTPDCGRVVFNQDLGKLVSPRSATTRRCTRYVLRRLMADSSTVSAIAAELGVSWHTANTIAMQATAGLVRPPASTRLIRDPSHEFPGPAKADAPGRPGDPLRRQPLAIHRLLPTSGVRTRPNLAT